MGGHHEQTDEAASLLRSSRFLHGNVAESLRHRVNDGRLSAGSKLPPLREIAAEFDVSTMTVRRAIRTLEVEGYVHRIPAVGMFVRRPTARRVKTVTFIATDLFSPFEVALAKGIQSTCREHGWQVQIIEGDRDESGPKTNPLRHVVAGSRGAIILPSCTPENVRTLRELRRAGSPFVLVDRGVPGLGADLVESDHEAAAHMATEYLLRQGHRVVRLVTPRPRITSEELRIEGYERALAEAGIEAPPEWKSFIDPESLSEGDRQNRRWKGAYQAMLPVLRDLEPPVGVFAHNAGSGWGVYEACRELGLRIPEDVSVVCIDDSDIARAMTPPMAAIGQRTDIIGQKAVELLRRRIDLFDGGNDSEQVYTHAVIGVDLIRRPSVAAAAVR